MRDLRFSSVTPVAPSVRVAALQDRRGKLAATHTLEPVAKRVWRVGRQRLNLPGNLRKGRASDPMSAYVQHSMSAPVDTKDPTAVEAAVQAAYLAMFPNGNRLFVPRIFGWAIECFTGGYADYQAVDARYHDFEHTLQGTLCMARLLHGRHRAGAQPVLSRQLFELGMIAILLHDTGYLKHREDREGTGAKYTITHVQRSAEFAARLLAEKGIPSADIQAVQSMIGCTGVDAHLEALPFHDGLERTVGFALATADLLGQMAADDYLEKLPVLYAEFAEAAAFTGDPHSYVASFSSAGQLLERTPAFWEEFVKPKLKQDFGGLAVFLNEPFPGGLNPYVERIEAHIAKLRLQLAAGGTVRPADG